METYQRMNSNLLLKFNLDASDHFINEIYTKCKENSNSENEQLNVDEFQIAWDYVCDRSASMDTNLFGFTKGQLIFLMVGLIIVSSVYIAWDECVYQWWYLQFSDK